jgi:hypothetical protein
MYYGNTEFSYRFFFCFFFLLLLHILLLWRDSPTRARAASFLRFLDYEK